MLRRNVKPIRRFLLILAFVLVLMSVNEPCKIGVSIEGFANARREVIMARFFGNG
jgi:hypothetical protein